MGKNNNIKIEEIVKIGSTPIASDRAETRYTIVFLMNGAKQPRGGEFLTFYLVKNLRQDLFRLKLIYCEEGKITKMIKEIKIDAIQVPLSKDTTSLFPQELLYHPLKLIRFLRELFRSMFIFKLIKILKTNNVDLIYCADTFSKVIGGISGKLAGCKIVAPCHADYSGDMFQNITGRLLKLIDSFIPNVVIAVSEKVKTYFIPNKFSSKAITIYNGIDAGIFNPENVDGNMKMKLGLKEGSIVIGSIGVLEKDKGQKYLFEAIAKLKSGGITNLVCLVCGTGPEEENLKKLAHVKSLVDEVLFLGFRNDIPKILKILDMVVIASLTTESFSMLAVESMAMKVPVIATNVGGLPEVVDDERTGILVPPGDVGALCNAIKYLIKNPEVRLEMGENGRARVLERFTIEKNARRTEEVFLEILRNN